jgi:hypothetical protein
MNKEVKFTPFQGAVPEGTKAGETFDLVTTYRLEPDGDVCVTKLGDIDAPDYKSDKSMVRPGMDDEVAAIQKSMMDDGTSQAM